MDISDETLQSSFSAMADDELLRRWHGELTDEARPIARAELEKRGLDFSAQAFDRLLAQDAQDNLAVRRRQRSTASRILLRVALAIVASVGAALAALVLGIGH
jgi:hypothetical protein